jgi:hypothetical protein
LLQVTTRTALLLRKNGEDGGCGGEGDKRKLLGEESADRWRRRRPGGVALPGEWHAPKNEPP